MIVLFLILSGMFFGSYLAVYIGASGNSSAMASSVFSAPPNCTKNSCANAIFGVFIARLYILLLLLVYESILPEKWIYSSNCFVCSRRLYFYPRFFLVCYSKAFF